MNVIAELKNNDMMAVNIVKTVLIDESIRAEKFPKTSDADRIHWQGTEKITLKSNDNVTAIHEINQSTDIAHRNGVEHIVWKKEVLRKGITFTSINVKSI